MPPSTPFPSLAKRYYGCNYAYGDDCDNGLSYGARVGIGIGIAAAAFFVILLLSIFARQRRQRALQSMRPQFQTTNIVYPPQGGQAYMPQTGYTPGGEPQGYGAHYNTGAPAPTYGGNANSSYPPPAGPPPADQPEMVNGQAYAPPTQPPPAYQHKAAEV